MVQLAWDHSRGGTVKSTNYYTQWKTNQKWAVLNCTVQWKSANRPVLGKAQSILLDDSLCIASLSFSCLAFVIETLLVKQIGLNIKWSPYL